MKSKLYIVLTIALFTSASFKAFSQANTSLSNLASATAVNHGLVPGTTGLISLGSGSIGWKYLYLTNGVYINGTQAFSTPLSSNTAAGLQALKSITSGNNNSAYGYHALYNITTGYANVGIGVNALYNNKSGDHLVAIGDSALLNNSSGLRNTAIGSLSLYKNTTGDDNTAEGYQTLYVNTTGANNIAAGFQALYTNTTGSNNVANGTKALYLNTTGYSNIAFGIKALYSNTSGRQSVAVGDSALYKSTGSSNVAIGSKALYNTITGHNNAAVGYNANVSSSSASNATVVGSNAYAACSNCLVLGGVKGTNGANADVNVGIGTTNPAAKLHVAGGDEVLEGNLNITSDQKSIQFASPTSTPAPMMYMFPSSTVNYDRMVIAHSPAYPNWGLQYSDLNDNFDFLGNGTSVLHIDLSSHYIGIGTTTPAYSLDVCGTIRAKEVRVETGWCDYVFDKNYKLKPLDEVEQYISQNKHLPGIAPAGDVEKNGLKVGEMNKAMMEKIEELTLYVIELSKENKKLQQEIDDIKK